MHTEGLLEIAIVASGALLLGLLLQRFRQPAIVGYIAAGVILGPSGFGLINDRGPVQVLAEFGVLMLLFIVGMELSLRGFRRVMRVALLGAGAQIVISVLIMLALSQLFGHSLKTAMVLGFVVALSSTAVAIKLLEEIGELRTDVGRTAISVLIAQDLAVVPMLLLIAGMAGGEGIEFSALLKLAVALGLLAVMIFVLTRREKVGVPFARAVEGNVELTAITGLAYCFGGALLSAAMGMSAAYGAFLAGLWIGNSTARGSILGAALPIQSVLLMVFFLSIGLLLDVGYIWQHLGEVLTLLAIVTLCKTAMNVIVLRALGEPWSRAWLAGVVIGQVGEFSFVIVSSGVAAGLIGFNDSRILVSVIALSLILSPFWLLVARRLDVLFWPSIGSFRQLLRALFGRETRAVALATQQTVQFTINLGAKGVEAAHTLVERNETAATAENPEDVGDAAFQDGEVAGEGGTDEPLAAADARRDPA